MANNNNNNDNSNNNDIGDVSSTNCYNGDARKNDDSWFTETDIPMNSDESRIAYRIDEKLDERKSKFQTLLTFKNKLFGRCLALDNALQCTELDESSYQEMMAFLPLNVHRSPKRVLIIGGGDGGVAREVAKHPLVEEIVQCEIDEEVVKVSKQFLPFMAEGFKSSKLKLLIVDGAQYVHDNPDSFDVIITDSSDPIGPAVALFEADYFNALHICLRPGGIICSQAESYWFELDFIKQLMAKVNSIFARVAYASTSVPSYPSGQIGFLLASKDEPEVNFQIPRTIFTCEDVEKYQLKYYSAEMHRCAFVLPNFVTKQLQFS